MEKKSTILCKINTFCYIFKEDIFLGSTFDGLIEMFIFQASLEIDHELLGKRDIFTSTSQ